MDLTFPHLTRAPIREALLDIRVEPREDVTAERLSPFVEKVRTTFQVTAPIRSVRAEVDLQRDDASVRSCPTEILGTICWNESKTRAVQCRIDGFSVNHVSGYESWSALRDEARRLWADYLSVAAPVRVVRCALRYINRIELPLGVDLSNSLLTRPEVGGELPQLLEEYLMRLVISFDEGRKAVVTQATEPVATLDTQQGGLILDIDVFSNRPLDVHDDAIWDEFEKLRSMKNLCFFKSLNPKLWEAYK